MVLGFTVWRIWSEYEKKLVLKKCQQIKVGQKKEFHKTHEEFMPDEVMAFCLNGLKSSLDKFMEDTSVNDYYLCG